METATLAAVAGLVLLLVVVLGGWALARSVRRLREQVRFADRRIEALASQVETLTRRSAATDSRPASEAREYLITTAGRDTGDVAEDRPRTGEQLTAGEFTSVALGESMLKVVSWGYGVRRALAPETRHRIRFEMRRATKSARKQRRRDQRSTRRPVAEGAERTEDRFAEGAA